MRIFLIFLLFLSLPAKADSFTATYGIYTGGFHVVDMTGVFSVADDGYSMTMDAKTIGLLGRLAPWAGALQTTGIYKPDGTPVPQAHSFASTWRGKVETTQFTYDNQGRFAKKIYTDERGNTHVNSHDQTLSDGTIDMLTGLYRSLLAAQQGNCSTDITSFDGKRRYNMAFQSDGEGEIRKNRYSIYAGAAEICTIEIEPDGGKWREKPRGWMSLQEQSKGKGQLPRLWYAQPEGLAIPIPVKFMIKTNYGTMLMHLRGIVQ